MKNSINENQNLPLNDLEKLGLYKNGEFYISLDNMEALQAGRRTDLLTLQGLEIDGISIQNLDAKLSLYRNEHGEINLNIHPIYNQPQVHPLLNSDEFNQLISGEKHLINKLYKNKDDQIIDVNIEYDKETKEFVSYDPKRLPQLVQINGIPLSKEQQDDFREGKIVELEDGTKLQHSATDSRGILSDRKRLIISVLIDGGLSYLIFRELKNLADNKNSQTEGLTKSYNETLAKVIFEEKNNFDKDKTVNEYYKENNSERNETSRYNIR